MYPSLILESECCRRHCSIAVRVSQPSFCKLTYFANLRPNFEVTALATRIRTFPAPSNDHNFPLNSKKIHRHIWIDTLGYSILIHTMMQLMVLPVMLSVVVWSQAPSCPVKSSCWRSCYCSLLQPTFASTDRPKSTVLGRAQGRVLHRKSGNRGFNFLMVDTSSTDLCQLQWEKMKSSL